MNVIFLDNYKRIRKLNADDSYPISLENIYNGQRVLDWHIGSINKKNIQYFYIGGYHIEKIINKYNNFSFYYDKNDQMSLRLIYDILKICNEDCLVIQSNILYKEHYIDSLLDSTEPIVIGVCEEVIDKNFMELTNDSLNYNGILKIKGSQINSILNNIEKFFLTNKEESYLQWINYLIKNKRINVNFIKAENLKDIINVENKIGLSKFILGTKAQTLETLKNLVNNSIILEQLVFTVKQWNEDSELIYNEIKSKYKDKTIVIRSSSLSEDCFNQSNAGKFESYLDIDVMNKEVVKMLIDKVIYSYNSGDGNNQVLIQQYISNSTMSGVIFTRDLEDSSPYYLINYDDESGLTDTVTSGKSKDIKSKIILKNKFEIIDEKFKKIIKAVKEIESLTGYDGLDMEFIIDNNNIYIVQVRPIVSYKKEILLTDEDVFKEVKSLKEYVSNIFRKKINLAGSTTILGNMPDWNPAELIGSSPRPLSLSLYQKLITDGIWTIAREQLGYKSLGYEPLVVSLSGKPYVDVRKSLNSLLPKDLDAKLCEKIVNYQIEKLRNTPCFHDKIEFKIAKTIIDFNFTEYEEELLNNSFTKEEVSQFRKCLTRLTNNILVNVDSILDKQKEKLNKLVCNLESIDNYNELEIIEIPNIINILINDCILNGILPFSILARFAFISMSFLRTLKEKGIINDNEYDKILLSIPTVAHDFKVDNELLNLNKISKSEFLRKYGHLRPNTYDINSLNYIEGYEIYFKNLQKTTTVTMDEECSWIDTIFKDKSELINEQLRLNNINCDYLKLKDFIRLSISGREWSKFEFTKNVSKVLELVDKLGQHFKLTKDDMSYISLDKILSLAKESPSYSFEKELVRECEYKKKKFMLTQLIKLPSLILSPWQVEEFSIIESVPNYITNKMISSEIVEITSLNIKFVDIENKIVLIENADPGYDWIFSNNIKGLITKYGGAASHMSIRCAEFGIPAAIGTGEIIYNNIKEVSIIELNCEAKQIKVVK
ncbi:PEP/pyruvate-binding domain-containing protein [Clostridium butyricum]|uniref:PEP/pyruvate-binding domain-containing protein n=1 Tax=Clostridium butyricum TaxID=1492 RepID=UPI003D33966A